MKLEPSLDMLQAQVELRVLVGPQAGSCLSLSAGEYTLGTSDDCEVILMGPRLEAIHARISFDGDQITIVPVDGSVCDAQGNELTDVFPLRLGMPVDLSGVWVCVDSVDAPWPDPADVVPMAVTSPNTSAQANEAQDATVVNPPPSDPLRRRARVTLLISAVSLGLIVLAGIAAGVWIIGRQTPPAPALSIAKPQAPLTPPSQQKVIQIVRNLDLTNAVEVSTNDKGVVTVTGYLADAATRAQFVRALENVSPPPMTAIYVDGELLESARRVLSDKFDPARIKIHADSISNGVLKVRGATLSPSVRDNTFEMLKADIPGLRKIEGPILFAEDLPQDFQDRLTAAGLSKKLQIVSRQPEFSLRGTINDDDLRQWESTLLAFTEDYGKILPVRASIRVVQKKSPVNVQIIVGGSMPFVISDTGQRVTRGGDINGHTLITVKDSEVVFEGNEKIKISR